VGEHVGIVLAKPQGLESKRFYIAAKEVKKNTLMVAPEGHSALLTKTISLIKFHHSHPREQLPHSGLHARIRHRGSLHSGMLKKRGARYFFVFSKPVEAVAPGQLLVLYNGERVIACGEIRL
jgi:tRNA U34 2-thiouridine synthase MnmA/TrmU